jgi:hypothetical protein
MHRYCGPGFLFRFLNELKIPDFIFEKTLYFMNEIDILFVTEIHSDISYKMSGVSPHYPKTIVEKNKAVSIFGQYILQDFLVIF